MSAKSMDYFGRTGMIADVDLSEMKVRKKKLSRELVEKYIGGRGLNIKLLSDSVGPATRPFDPDNVIIFSAGPLIRTGFPVANRCVVTTKSPLSYYAMGLSGGYFSAELKATGFDVIVVKGQSERPVQIAIQDGEVQIVDASELWGLGTYETQKKIRERCGSKFKIGCIGPAGERMVRIAGIMFDQRAAGRGGLGAVMGSKNLKAIAVKGSGRAPISNPDHMKSLVRKLSDEIKKKPGPRPTFPKFGTLGAIETIHKFGLFPCRNFQQSVVEHIDAIGLEGLSRFSVNKHPAACFDCPVRCTHDHRIKGDSPIVTQGPEYESVAAFGGMCAISNPKTIIHANFLCNDLGLDTISTGATLAFVMECTERGMISHSETGLGDFAFGKDKECLEAIQMMASRKGEFAYLLGEGTRLFSEKVGQGASRFAPHVKGLELGMYEPRSSNGMALVFSIANRGGCHHSQGYPLRDEIREGTFFETKEKGRLVRNLAQSRILVDSATYCGFLTGAVHWALPEGLSAATGIDFTWDMLKECSDRVNNLERLFILREGSSIKEDSLPERFFTEPLQDGPAKGHKVDRNAFDNMRREYFQECGWSEDGVPKQETIMRLGL